MDTDIVFFKKNANFFAENRQAWLKLVIITLTPGFAKKNRPKIVTLAPVLHGEKLAFCFALSQIDEIGVCSKFFPFGRSFVALSNPAGDDSAKTIGTYNLNFYIHTTLSAGMFNKTFLKRLQPS
jgi:hypothetical protein